MSSVAASSLFPVSVHVFFKQPDDRVLMLRRQGTGFADGMYSVPAGHLTHGETVTEAAAREAREEVGLSVSPTALVAVGVMQRRSTEERIDFFFEAREWSGEPRNLEPGKCDRIAWFAMSSLPKDTIPYVRRALENTGASLWFEEYEMT